MGMGIGIGRVAVRGGLGGLLLLGGCTAERPPDIARAGREPYAAQLHIHGPMSESIGSFRGHVAQARALGTVDVIWFTDHDWRVQTYGYARRFRFEAGAGVETFLWPKHRTHPVTREAYKMQWVEDGGRKIARPYRKTFPAVARGASHPVRAPVFEGRGALRLEAAADPEARAFGRYQLRFQVDENRDVRPLAAEVRVRLAVYPVGDPGPDGRILIRFLLSEQAPDQRAELDYWLARAAPEDSRERRKKMISDHLVDFVPGQWNDLTFEVSRDAVADGLGGLDNSMTGILIGVEARAGASVAAVFDDLRIEHAVDGEALLARARDLIAPLAGEGLRLYVGQEISYGVHINDLGPDLAMVDYRGHPAGLDGGEAVAFIHRHGNIAVVNHMYGVRPALSDPDDAGAVRAEIDTITGSLLAHGCFGADALEVGYPVRGAMPLSAHLEAWDRVGMAGFVITGLGSSDSHANRRGWKDGNNWVTWIWAGSAGQEDLMAGIRSGACFFGNPARWDGQMDLLTADGRRMGDVVIGGPPRQEVTFLCDGLQPGWEARLVRNGAVFESVPVRRSWFRATRSIRTDETQVVRFCIHDGGGQAVVCSNPIYFYPRRPAGHLPAVRLGAKDAS